MPASFVSQRATGPYAQRAYGGLMPPLTVTGMDFTAVPMASIGVVRITAWWPDVAQIQLVRISPDGTRTPVRGGYPATVVGSTRRNYSTNPGIETSTAGYTAGTGTPTLTRIARVDDPNGAWSLNASNAGAGTSEVNIPHSLIVGTVTVGLDLKTSALPSGVSISLGWNNSSGTPLTATTVALTSGQYTPSVGAFVRQVVTLAPPVGAAQVGVLKITATGMPAGGAMGLDRVTIEAATSDGSYFDGDTQGGYWTGTAELSTSVMAPVQIIDDGEAPLDVPVTYEMATPGLQGIRLASTPVTLDSQDRVWLTHPSDPGEPLEIFNIPTPDLEHVLDQGIFPILDSKYPFSVSAAKRQAPSGDLELIADTFAARDQLLEGMFSDGTPVLLRTPTDFGYGEGMWIVLGNIRESAGGQKPNQPLRTLAARFQVVAPPADVLVS